MEETPRSTTPTLKRHQRQVIWQILIPFLVMAGGLIALGCLVAFGRSSPTAMWRDVALVWMLAPALVVALVLVVALAVVIYGMARLKKAAPRFTTRAQELAAQGARGIRRVADGASSPFIWMRGVSGGVRSLFNRTGKQPGREISAHEEE